VITTTIFFSFFDVAMTVEYSVGTDLRQKAREGYLGMLNSFSFFEVLKAVDCVV
jgi:hypothetical protein